MIGMVLCAREGRAQQTDEDIAVAHYQKAKQLFEEEKYRECIAELETAYEYYPAPIFIYNIARAYSELQEFEKALEYYEHYLSLGDDDPETIASAQEAIKHLRPIVEARSFGTLNIIIDMEGASVFIDGEMRGVTPLEPIKLHNGVYNVRIEKATYLPYEVDVVVEGTTNLVINLEPEPAEFVETEPKESTETSDRTLESEVVVTEESSLPETDPLIYAGWSALGVGMVGLAVALVVDIGNQATIDEYEETAALGDEGRYLDLKSTIETNQLVSAILYGVGGAAVIAGVTMLIIAYTSDGEPTPIVFSPTLSSEGFGVSFEWRF